MPSSWLLKVIDEEYRELSRRKAFGKNIAFFRWKLRLYWERKDIPQLVFVAIVSLGIGITIGFLFAGLLFR